MSIEREWKQIKLKNVGECLRGVSYKPLIDLLLEKSTESCYLLRSTNIQDSKLTLRDIQIVRNSRVRDQQVLQPKDIVICMANGSKRLVGKSVQFNLEPRTYTIGAFMGIFRVKESNNTDYINYLFCTNRYKYYISTLVSGSSINNLKPSDIESLPFFIPSSFEEQKAIVSVLEKWDKFIELLDQKIQTKKNIKKYLTRELLNEGIKFGGFNGKWQNKRLGEIGFFKTSSVDKKIREGERMVNLVNYMDVYKHKEISNISKNDLMKVSAKDQQVETNNLLKGDILFTPSSETPDDIGHSIVIAEDLTNTLYSYHLVRFRPSITLDLGFSHYFCNQSEVLRQFTKYSNGITRFTLSMDSFSRVVVKIPPIAEQKAISSILSRSDEEIAMLEKQKDIIEEQRKYLLNNLVTGEIRLPKFRNNK